jgi:hypothetical protein
MDFIDDDTRNRIINFWLRNNESWLKELSHWDIARLTGKYVIDAVNSPLAMSYFTHDDAEPGS